MNFKDKETVILSSNRTPIGSFQGKLSGYSAPELASLVIKGIIDKLNINSELIDEVILGNVLSAGQGQAPARQATIKSGCPNTVGSLTINKMCGSGLKAIMLADQAIKVNDAELIMAGGMESMSNAPHIINEIRSGNKLGHSKVIDSLIHDGLWDSYTDQHMGNCAEMLATHRGYTRQKQDEYAIESYTRAIKSIKEKIFKSEIIPVSIKTKSREIEILDNDQEPRNLDYDKVPKLRPVFEPAGTITAANSSKLSDGASVSLISSLSKAEQLGIKPVARIIAHASVSHEPEWFTTAPMKAINEVLQKACLNLSDIDLWEINEAFSVVPMAAMEELNIDRDKINIYGGSVALGHPIGATGARILTTLINGLSRERLRLGLAAICIGGGEASAMIIQRND